MQRVPKETQDEPLAFLGTEDNNAMFPKKIEANQKIGVRDLTWVRISRTGSGLRATTEERIFLAHPQTAWHIFGLKGALKSSRLRATSTDPCPIRSHPPYLEVCSRSPEKASATSPISGRV